MQGIHADYVTNERGEQKAVLVPIEDWRRILERLEMLEDVQRYDRAKAEPSDPVDWHSARADLER
ncbi:MAG: hypothetical protein ACPGU7_15245 [Gammaproteobacteria bacterium]